LGNDKRQGPVGASGRLPDEDLALAQKDGESFVATKDESDKAEVEEACALQDSLVVVTAVEVEASHYQSHHSLRIGTYSINVGQQWICIL